MQLLLDAGEDGTEGRCPGADVGLNLVRSADFLPLTDAYLLHAVEPPFEHVVSVVIVNTRHATSLVPLITLA